jgi:osmotically-inducible protein OsmY
MKKTVVSIMVTLFLVAAMGCSNWNRWTPKGMDDTAIAEEIRKNQLMDHITGMTIDVKNGVVTLHGDVKNASVKQTAIEDARKVHGVKRIFDQIAIKP